MLDRGLAYITRMTTRLITYFAKLGLVFALFVALTGAGLAHRAAPPEMDEGLAAYLAAGGSLSDLCGDADIDGAVPGCAACHLVSGAVLPPVITATHLLQVARSGPAFAPRNINHAVFATDPSRPVRAPPFVAQ